MKKDNPAALLVGNEAGNGKRFRDKGGNKSRGGGVVSNLNFQKNVRCHSCNEKGHFSRECPNRRKTDFRNPGLTALANTGAKDEANVLVNLNLL